MKTIFQQFVAAGLVIGMMTVTTIAQECSQFDQKQFTKDVLALQTEGQLLFKLETDKREYQVGDPLHLTFISKGDTFPIIFTVNPSGIGL